MGMFCNGKVQFTSIYANLTKHIVDHMEQYPGREIAYAALVENMGIPARSLSKYLNELSVKCHELGMPMVSAAVTVNGAPYDGFLEQAAELGYGKMQALQQKEAAFGCDWSELKRRMLVD